MLFFLFGFYFVYPLVIIVEFIYVVFLKKSNVPPVAVKLAEFFAVAIFPFMFLTNFDTGDKNDCCIDDVFFSPQHRLTIYVIIVCCASAYFYSSYRKDIASPLIEITVNCLLLAGIVLNIFITIQAGGDALLDLIGTGSIIILFVIMLIKNQQLLIKHLENLETSSQNLIEKFCWKILRLNPFIKTPLFILLCLPLLVIITAILLIFGQKPDSLIRAFTDTYHLGLSQLNHECDNVNCGGHYLCSVAANGHKKIVKPRRLGERGGHAIICNRQLLVSNAFEELLQHKLPFLHKPVRKAYNKVGNIVHRYYDIFNNKYVADLVYIMMKPLEWLFIIVLYTFDKKPENRIAVQYLSEKDRLHIKNLEK